MSYTGPIPFPVIEGGSGDSSHTAFAVLAGGTTSTNPVQSVSGLGTSGQVLTSNGAGALPTWQAGGAGAVIVVAIQTFTASGTYTPTSGMIYAIIECQGGGGGGGGSGSSTGPGGGGGAGGYSRGVFSAATIGASQTVTINTGGAGNSNAAGSNGGSVSVGALISANGGTGGAKVNGSSQGVGSAGGTATGGSVNITGASGSSGTLQTGNFSLLPPGGASMFGSCASNFASVNTTGSSATGFGAGGGGSLSVTGNTTGGAGANGIVVITEYCN